MYYLSAYGLTADTLSEAISLGRHYATLSGVSLYIYDEIGNVVKRCDPMW